MINSGIRVNWRGKLVIPEGTVDDQGCLRVSEAAMPEATAVVAATDATDAVAEATEDILAEAAARVFSPATTDVLVSGLPTDVHMSGLPAEEDNITQPLLQELGVA
jgi:hypothetical protein